MLSKKLLILGGDARIVALANSFASDNEDVCVYGFNDDVIWMDNIKCATDLASALDSRDIIICGLPVTNDDITIHTPLFDGKLYFYDLFKTMKKDQILIGGKVTNKILNLGKIYGVSIIDYFNREELAVLNAIPGALPKEV